MVRERAGVIRRGAFSDANGLRRVAFAHCSSVVALLKFLSFYPCLGDGGSRARSR